MVKRLVLLATALNGSLALFPVRDCQAVCNNIATCRNNANVQGSYCKTGNPAVCFGLYYSDILRRNICYSPSDPTCPQAIPVKCIPSARSEEGSAESDDISTTEPVVADTVIAAAAPALAGESTNAVAPFTIGDDICQALCLLTNSCAFDPFAHGTYCKSYKSPAVCFGFYFRVFPFSVCFSPNDPTCPETRPVPCGFNLNQLVLDPPTDA